MNTSTVESEIACSILYDSSNGLTDVGQREQPRCFPDLNLDQIIAGATAGHEEYDLKPIFHSLLQDVETIGYRQEVFRDFENELVLASVKRFSERMRVVRQALAQADKIYYALQKRRIRLDAIGEYCEATTGFARELTLTVPHSRGLLAFAAYLSSYTRSASFSSLAAETERLQGDLAGIQYVVLIDGKRVEVSRYGGEPDYAAQVLETFEKFRQGAVKETVFTFHSSPEMNHIEAAILDRVALLFPDIFAALATHCARYREFLDATVIAFDRAAQFYIAWLEYLAPLKRAGLRFCYPEISERSERILARDAFDIALAHKLAAEKKSVVVNDFEIQDPERVLVVSGANQGGKSTFARMVGQIFYLADLGCPVPAHEARLARIDRVFTHFEREERVETLTGKLEESLIRMREILDQATVRSLLIMNESFDSTTASDALFLSKETLARVIDRGMLCICVTFLDELASLSSTTTSYVATVDPEDPARRTFKVVRKPAEGLAYAMAVAQKYGLTYEQVTKRLAS